MELYQMGEVLALSASIDNRTVDEGDVRAWHTVVQAALGNVQASDAQLAVVAHYGASDKRLMPSHVVEFVRKLRRTRKVHIRPAYPPELAEPSGKPLAPNTFEPLMQWREKALELIANGLYQPDPPTPQLLEHVAQLSDEPALPHSAARLWPAPEGWQLPAIPVPPIPPAIDPLANLTAERLRAATEGTEEGR